MRALVCDVSVPRQVVSALLGRAQAAADVLLGAKNALPETERVDRSTIDATAIADALDLCAAYGVQEALIDALDVDSLIARAVRVRPVVQKRLEDARQLLASTSATGDGRIEIIVNGFKALFGGSFVVLPEVSVADLDSGKVAAFGTSVASPPTDDRVWLWLQQVAETHPRVRRFETFMMAAQAWGGTDGNPAFAGAQLAQLTPGAAFASSAYGWQALSDDDLAGTAGRARGAQAIMGIGPATLVTEPFAGFVIDEWPETLASSSVTTGISFEYDQPVSQAPQCFLFAVPGNFEDPAWKAEHLAEIVRDTMTLAKARLVDLDALSGANVGGIFPALMFPIATTAPSVSPTTPSPVTAAPDWIAWRGSALDVSRMDDAV